MALIHTRCCERSWKDYLNTLVQLLPRGYAWDWSANSIGLHLLAAWADELARVHQFYCDIVKWGISQFTGNVTGWSAPEYELLLRNRFGIDAVVSDGLVPTNCQSFCDAPLLDEGVPFIVLITVDDLSMITDEVRSYLQEYKQSHTAIHLRDRSVSLEVVDDIDVADCNDPCDISLYEQPFHIVNIKADWTYRYHDLLALPGWNEIVQQLRNNTRVRRLYA